VTTNIKNNVSGGAAFWLAATCAFFAAFSIAEIAIAEPSAETQAIIQKLQAAKQRDLAESNNPSVGAARQGDCAAQADLADDVIKRLQHGFSVPQWQIDLASEVPPKSVKAEKDKLLAQLKEVRDRQKADEKLDYGDNPVGLDRLHQREANTKKVIEKLETGEFVAWSEVVQALKAGR
jgi:hypothetical protein